MVLLENDHIVLLYRLGIEIITVFTPFLIPHVDSKKSQMPSWTQDQLGGGSNSKASSSSI